MPSTMLMCVKNGVVDVFFPKRNYWNSFVLSPILSSLILHLCDSIRQNVTTL